MKGSLVAQNKQSRKGDAPLIAWFWVKTEGRPSGNRETERKREREREREAPLYGFVHGTEP